VKTWQKSALWYSVLTLLYLFPLVLNFRNLAGHGDAWQFVWNFWWVQKVFTTPSLQLFYTTLLHWPHGISLLLQTMTLVNSVPAALLSPILGYVTTYNFLVILHFILSGLGMYFLCYHFSKNHFAAFIGGFLFAFSPYRFAHYYGHLHLMTTEVLPFGILFLIKTLEGNRRSWIGAAILCVMTAYTDLYYFLFLFLVSIALVIWKFPRTRTVLFHLVLIAGITALAVAPYFGPLLAMKYHTQEFNILGHDPVANSSDLKSFFIPGMRSMFGGLTARWWSWWSAPWEIGNYIGYSVIILLLWGFWKSRSKIFLFWMILGIIFAVLSLGPYLHIGGRVITSFQLPYAWLEHVVPLLSLAGVASRFFVVTSLSLAILVSLALARVLQESRRGEFIAAIFFVILAFEYLPAPVIVSPVIVSDFYQKLAADHASYALIDVSDAPAKVLYYQTIHGKPLIGGYTSRPTMSANRFLEETPVIRDLVADPPDGQTGGERFHAHTPPRDGKKILTDLQVRYILIPRDERGLERYVAKLKLPLVYEDSMLEAYQAY